MRPEYGSYTGKIVTRGETAFIIVDTEDAFENKKKNRWALVDLEYGTVLEKFDEVEQLDSFIRDLGLKFIEDNKYDMLKSVLTGNK